MMLRALAYILTHGRDGLREATEAAVLNARYIAHGLVSDYDKPFDGAPMHEVVFTDKRQARKGVHTLDIAKRLIDYGFHPMTIYFPLIVSGRDADRADRIGRPSGARSVYRGDAFDRAKKRSKIRSSF